MNYTPPCLNMSAVAVAEGNPTCNASATDWTNTVNCSDDFYNRTCSNAPHSHFCHHQLPVEGSMYTIAKEFGVPLDALCKANGMKQCECLPLIQDNVLRIPVNPRAAAYRDLLKLGASSVRVT